MNPRCPVKKEFVGGSSSSSWPMHDQPPQEAAEPPRPMDGLHEAGPPPFLTKTFDMVDDFTTAHIVSWSRGGHSFVVWDPNAFSATLLPTYFKHVNFSSFVRQLNTYGFRKVDSEKWEFANEAFLRGQKHLLKHIRRKKAAAPPPQAAVELGRFGQEEEADLLRRDKHVLLMELVRLRQQQQNTRLYVQEMELRLRGTEKKQQQIMRFLAKAMKNPDFINQLVQQKERRKELDQGVSKNRLRLIEAGETNRSNQGLNRVKVGFDEFCGSEVSELEALALEMQRLKAKPGNYDRELEDGFWQELLDEGKMAKNGDEDEEM